jgi:hypothetical protein
VELTVIAGTPKGVLLSHGNVVSASMCKPGLRDVASADYMQLAQSGRCYTSTSPPRTATLPSYPSLISWSSSSRTPLSLRVYQLVTDESRPLPMLALGNVKEISQSSSLLATPFTTVMAKLTEPEYHGWCPSRLGTHP